jgi:hypothetical protein
MSAGCCRATATRLSDVDLGGAFVHSCAHRL